MEKKVCNWQVLVILENIASGSSHCELNDDSDLIESAIAKRNLFFKL